MSYRIKHNGKLVAVTNDILSAVSQAIEYHRQNRRNITVEQVWLDGSESRVDWMAAYRELCNR